MTRIRITGGPWPERIGAEGSIVEAPPGYNRYPFHKLPPSEVIVLLDDDPLIPATCRSISEPAWTCCLSRKHIEATP